MQTLTVDLGSRSYPIYIGSGILGDGSLLLRHLPSAQILVVSNETVAPLYLDRLLAGLGEARLDTLVLPDGESFKTLDTVSLIFDRLMAAGFDRGCTVAALGGGVIGDMAGFAAACYQRGVGFAQVPTTLLAQVDSSVGGKTGVNHPRGKNMIGAFHQPVCVVADIATLNTLPPREVAAGLAEVIKYGLLGDAEFFDWLEINMQRLLALEPEALAWAVRRCCRNKARIVAADERESGSRALLNLGHTFGHAIEAATGYGKWLHGEAVAAGMMMAADLSHRQGWLTREELDRTEALLRQAGLPVAPPAGMSAGDFRNLMLHDKKVRDRQLRLVLLDGIGRARLSGDFDPQALDATLETLSSQHADAGSA